jgi:hypothetical protein
MTPDETEAMVSRFEHAREQAVTQAIQPDGTSVTTPYCDWFARRCGGCGHTFREGDRVRADRNAVGRRRTVRHLDPLLGCADGDGPGEVAADELTSRFHAAMDAAVPPPLNLRLERLFPGDFLLRRGAGDRPDCLRCGDTFRPFEVVVRCPCGELPCQMAVHRDPQRGLPCFDQFWPALRVDYCPVQKRAVK